MELMIDNRGIYHFGGVPPRCSRLLDQFLFKTP